MATKRAVFEENRVSPVASVKNVTAPQGGQVAEPTSPPVEIPTNPLVDTPTTQKFSVHGIETEMIYELKQIAARQRRTMSEIVTEALSMWLDQNGGR